MFALALSSTWKSHPLEILKANFLTLFQVFAQIHPLSEAIPGAYMKLHLLHPINQTLYLPALLYFHHSNYII